MLKEYDVRIGIITSGGDAPGLNAVIRSAVLTAHERYGYEVLGIRQGFDGLLNRLDPMLLTPENVEGLHLRGGTILGAANRGSPFARTIVLPNGELEVQDASHEAIARLQELGIDALIVAGGDGTLRISEKLHAMGIPIVAVPKTIDNDLSETDVTFGFDTAIQTATEALDKLQTTAESHHRVMVLEVMGRDSGWIALVSGVAGGADVILIPEIPFHLEPILTKILKVNARGRRYSLVVVAEGAFLGDGEKQYLADVDPKRGRLGGIGNIVGNLIANHLENEVRVTVLGHLQRGGQPTPRDRWLATRFGSMAIQLIARQEWGTMVALQGTSMVAVPIGQANKSNFIDPNGEMVQMARDLGISFGV